MQMIRPAKLKIRTIWPFPEGLWTPAQVRYSLSPGYTNKNESPMICLSIRIKLELHTGPTVTAARETKLCKCEHYEKHGIHLISTLQISQEVIFRAKPGTHMESKL